MACLGYLKSSPHHLFVSQGFVAFQQTVSHLKFTTICFFQFFDKLNSNEVILSCDYLALCASCQLGTSKKSRFRMTAEVPGHNAMQQQRIKYFVFNEQRKCDLSLIPQACSQSPCSTGPNMAVCSGTFQYLRLKSCFIIGWYLIT